MLWMSWMSWSWDASIQLLFRVRYDLKNLILVQTKYYCACVSDGGIHTVRTFQMGDHKEHLTRLRGLNLFTCVAFLGTDSYLAVGDRFYFDFIYIFRYIVKVLLAFAICFLYKKNH